MGRMENSHPLFTKHADTLDAALTAIAERGYWSAYPESPSPKIYGEHAAADGEAAFRAYLHNDFPLKDQPATIDWVATERSPFGVDLDVRYPHPDVDGLLAAVTAAMPAWRTAGPQTRVGVCIEILARLHANVFELANAVHMTTGQAFVMGFQAGGPHALDRALEAIAYAYREMTRTPATATWEKQNLNFRVTHARVGGRRLMLLADQTNRQVLDLPLHDCPISLVEQCVRIISHHQQWHEVFEHRAGPRDERASAVDFRQRPAHAEPVFLWHVAFGDADETGEPCFRRE